MPVAADEKPDRVPFGLGPHVDLPAGDVLNLRAQAVDERPEVEAVVGEEVNALRRDVGAGVEAVVG